MTRPVAEVGSTASSYEILAKLAVGGMAEIFLARGASAAGVERYVVLKRVLRHHANNNEFVQMFLDEARLAAQLQHPNIAQVYDIGKLGDSYFFTMEYVHGETVRGLLQRAHGLRRPLPLATVLTIGAGAAAGLHHAHERIGTDGRPLGIVHRDVSPSNLMVSYEGGVKVVDFGVAKAAHRSHETRSGAVKGKISYLSPEQCRGSEIDRRSDIYSIGIVLWEMLTTERLYRRNSDFENMAAIVGEATPPPSTRRPDCPPELDAIAMRCLEKDPARRFQTADELHEALENVAMRMSSTLSTAALGRLMRELFGQRPEPWVELQTREQHPEVVTVTSEPLSSVSNISGNLDLELSSVRDLSQPGSHPLDGMGPRSDPAAHPTAPLRKVGPDQIPTTAMGAQNPPPGVGMPPAMAPGMPPGMPNPGVQMTMLGHMPPHVAAMRAHTPSVTPSQSSPIFATPSHGSVMPVPPAPYSYDASAQLGRVPTQPHPHKSKLPYWLFILIPATVIGITVGVMLTGDKEKGESQTDVAASDPVANPVADPPKPDETAKPDPVKADPITPEGSNIVAPPPDPVVGKQPEPDKQAEPDKQPAPTPDKTVEKQPVRKQPRPAPPTIEELVKQTRYSDAVAACGTPSNLDRFTLACTAAACKAKEPAKAKRWYALLPASKKPGVAALCKNAGVVVETPKPPDIKPDPKPDRPDPMAECKRDPMACPH